MKTLKRKTVEEILTEFSNLIDHTRDLGCTCVESGAHDKDCSGLRYIKKAEKLLLKARKELSDEKAG